MTVNELAYTLLDLVTTVQDDLKDSSFSATRIKRYLNYAQELIFNTHMFRFTEKSVVGSLTIGEYTYDQQTDHQVTIGGVLVDPIDSTQKVILDERNYLPHREFFAAFPDPSAEDNGMPGFWTEFGSQIYFNVPVDKAYTFRQRYYRFPTLMSSDSDVPEIPQAFRDLLEFYALFRAEKYRGNHDVAATYKQEYEDGLENMTIRYANVTAVAPMQMRSMRTPIYE